MTGALAKTFPVGTFRGLCRGPRLVDRAVAAGDPVFGQHLIPINYMSLICA